MMSSSSRVLAIFSKTPGLSPVKTRLANDVGKEEAQRVFCLCIDTMRTLATELSGKGVHVVWALAEEEALEHPFWSRDKSIHTGQGDLGDRLASVYGRLKAKYDQVALIGVDAPQLTAGDVLSGFDLLEQHDTVFGPANDGGFYFMAGKKSVLPTVWNAVEYSQPDTLQNLCKQLKQVGIATYVTDKVLVDIDTVDDLRHIMLVDERRIFTQKSVL